MADPTAPPLHTAEPGGQVVVVDRGRPFLSRVESSLTEAGLDVLATTDVGEAERALGAHVHDLLILGDLTRADRERLAVAARRACPAIELLVVFGKKGKSHAARADALGARAWLARPVSHSSLAAAAVGLARAARLERRLREREAELERALADAGQMDPRTGFYRLDRFKPMLATEVKRARRYRYPFSLLLVAFDRLPAEDDASVETAASRASGALSLAVTRSLREFDMPVAYGAGQLLIVMPHTPRRGARVVAERIRRQVGRTRVTSGDAELETTASVGLAAYEGSGEVSFAGLVREAAAALRISVEHGGNRVAEVPKTRRRQAG